MINRAKFYEYIKPALFAGHLSQSQVSGFEILLTEWELSSHTDLRWLAYMLGTAYHETAKTIQPIEEYGKGKNRPYGIKRKRSGLIYTTPDKIYYGRGFVQLTWYENYELMSRLLNTDLLNFPDSALIVPIATKIMFEGMTKGSSSFGDFTGKCLEMYFNEATEDWVGARRIINGNDRAEDIAKYSKEFYKALSQ